MSSSRFSRRGVLRSAATSLALAPFSAFVPADARAATASTARAKRVLLFCTMGTVPSIWTPKSVTGESSFVLSDSLAPLDAIRSDIVLIEGLPSGNTGDNHGSPDGLTGLGFGASGSAALISVDQFIGDKLAASGVKRPIHSLLLGADTNASGGKTMFNRANNLSTIGSPVSAFNAVFGSGSTSGPATSGMTDLLARRRKSTLDALSGQLKTLRGVVGAEAAARLDLHAESIRQIENRLSQGAGGGLTMGCASPTKPTDVTGDTLAANLIHLDILVSALACNATSVAAIQFGSDQAMQVNLPALGLQGDEHGLMIHSGAGDNFKKLTALEVWLSTRFVELVKRLKATSEPDGTGTMLDNTLVVWCRDMGDASAHNQKAMRFVFAGGKYLKTNPGGRYIAYPEGKVRHERALLNIVDAMGITDYKGFGDAKLADKTPLSELIA